MRAPPFPRARARGQSSSPPLFAQVRSVVFRSATSDGVVYNPVRADRRFLASLSGMNEALSPSSGELRAQLAALDHRGVRHVLLGATQYEHKVFVPAFSARSRRPRWARARARPSLSRALALGARALAALARALSRG